MINVQAGQQTLGAFAGPDEVVGRVALVRIPAGQIMLGEQLADPETGAGLQALLPPGMRAITLDLDEATASSNFLLPGNRVDLVGRVPGEGEIEDVARAIVQNVRVLAVGTQMSTARREEQVDDYDGGPAEAVKTVTLEVSVTQAAALELAYRSGATPRIVMRPHGDATDADTAAVTMTALRGRTERDAPAFDTNPAGTDGLGGFTDFASDAPATPAVPTRTITVIRGGVETRVEVETDQPADEAPADAPAPTFATLLGELLPDLPQNPQPTPAGLTSAGGLGADLDD